MSQCHGDTNGKTKGKIESKETIGQVRVEGGLSRTSNTRRGKRMGVFFIK